MNVGGRGGLHGALARLRAWAGPSDDDGRRPVSPLRSGHSGPAEWDRWTPDQIRDWEAAGQLWVLDNDVLPRACDNDLGVVIHPDGGVVPRRWPSAWPQRPSRRERWFGPPIQPGLDRFPDPSSGVSFDDKELFQGLGIRLSEMRADDRISGELGRLFVGATLPDGWRKEPADHTHWVYVLDERGLRRAEIFFKNTPHEQRAFVRVVDVGAAVAADLIDGGDGPLWPWHLLTEAERADVVTALESKLPPEDDAGSLADDHDRATTVRDLLASLTDEAPPTRPQPR